jgi:hypothetical protein
MCKPIVPRRITIKSIFNFGPSFPLLSLITNFPMLTICKGKAFKVER